MPGGGAAHDPRNGHAVRPGVLQGRVWGLLRAGGQEVGDVLQDGRCSMVPEDSGLGYKDTTNLDADASNYFIKL